MSEIENDPSKVNPFSTMSDEKIREHMIKLAQTIKDKNVVLDIYSVFNLERPVAGEQKQLVETEKFMSAIQKAMNPTKAKGGLTENETRIAQIGLDSVMSQIKSLDNDVPTASITKSGDIMMQIDTAKAVYPIIQYYVQAIASLRSKIPEQTTDQENFSAPPASTSKYDGLLAELDSFTKSEQK